MHRGAVSQGEHEPPACGSPHLPVSAARACDRPPPLGVHRRAEGRWCAREHGRARLLARQRVRRAAVAVDQIRRGLPAWLRERHRGTRRHWPLRRLLQRAPAAQRHERSPRPYTALAELEYPFHDRTITVTRCGRICMGTRTINLSVVFAGQNVGVKQVADQVWLVSFMDYDLGFFDNETCRIECAENPFDAKVLPMSPV